MLLIIVLLSATAMRTQEIICLYFYEQEPILAADAGGVIRSSALR
jgi:hypothetical protein